MKRTFVADSDVGLVLKNKDNQVGFLHLEAGDRVTVESRRLDWSDLQGLRPLPQADEIVLDSEALGVKNVIFGTGVRANSKGFVKWLLGHVAPRTFGRPFHFEAVLRGPDGRIKQRRRVWNTVTTAGKNGIADQILASPTLGKPTHMAVGTGSPSGTALGTENDRNALTSKTRSNAVVTMVGDWAAGDATAALTEAGVFDASSSGNMWLSTSFSVINKGANDTLQISWTLTIS